ncbi:helix-turn-helix domain-containing protein [Mucilaginibacter arboris]|uniref:Helix-turn-helix domain-containing protein n=1 Tax=Mucilaginibacter arboris TaxID=2682090 RepID=A0A7K1T175_9SPHI|nr:AraC family transcriptional regulator [Mucilaginibacter arboris]MVN23316.1 helix-turn-helix domain-containing protein [Mucilaginibacter arboris]
MKNYHKVLSNNNQVTCRFSSINESTAKVNNNFSLKFVLAGCKVYQIKKRKLSIYPDYFLPIKKGTLYSNITSLGTHAQELSIGFDNLFIKDFEKSCLQSDKQLLDNNINKSIKADEFTENIYPFKGNLKYNIGNLKAQIDLNIQDELLLNEYLYHCLTNYYTLYKQEVFAKVEKLHFLHLSTRNEIYRRLSLAKEFIYTNYDQNIVLEQIASYSCLSVNHLLRTFKQAFNQTPHQFLTQIRLQRSLFLLKNSKYPINEIVMMMGFDSSSSFIRLFKQKYYTTPLAYRSRFKSKNQFYI